MNPTLALRNQAMELLAADAATMGPVAGNKMRLYQNNFTPSEAMVMADLTIADFGGYADIVCGTGTQPEGLDPATNDSILTVKAPAGGFRWESTSMTNIPQTIYGYYLVDNAGAVLLAAKRLATPIVLTASGQVVDIGAPSIRLLANSMS